MNEPTPTPAELIEEYISLRTAKQQHDKQYDELVKLNFTDRMNEIEGVMLDKLRIMGADNIKTPSGTVYKKESTSVTVADPREFRRHIIGAEDWEALEWRVAKTVINDRVAAGEPIPPGVNRSVTDGVGFRRPSE
jgi:hypothetical protein